MGRVLRKDLPRVRLQNGVSVCGVPRHFGARKTLGLSPGQRRYELSRISSGVCYGCLFLWLISPRACSHSPRHNYSQSCNSDRDCAEYEWCASNFNYQRCCRNVEPCTRHIQIGHEYDRFNRWKYWHLSFLFFRAFNFQQKVDPS